MSVLEDLKKLINHENRSLRNIIALLFAFGLESLITTEKIFVCPEKNNARYGWMFIFAPAAIMAVISVMLSEDFWKITKGICYFRDEDNRDRRFPCYKARWSCFRYFFLPSSEFFSVAYNAVAAGSLWLFWAFLQGRYYACATKGNLAYQLQPAHLGKDVNKTEVNRINKIFDQAKTESQIIGFSIIIFIVIAPSILITLYRCCFERATTSIPDLEEFKEIEATEAVEAFKTKVKALAKREGEAKVEKFFKDMSQAPESSPDTLQDVYIKFKERTGFDASFDGEYDEEAAKAYRKAFDKTQEESAKAEIQRMVTVPQRGGGDEKCYVTMEHAYQAMKKEYPRSVGDLGEPYVTVATSEKTRKPAGKKDEGSTHELQPLAEQ